jgi:hypothetical protein
MGNKEKGSANKGKGSASRKRTRFILSFYIPEVLDFASKIPTHRAKINF